MKSSTRVCPWQRAWALDSWIRRLVHNPHKIVGGYIKEGQTVLDLGSGPGMFSIAMAEMVGEKGKVISVDIQEEMLQMLKRKSERAGLEYRIFIHKSLPDKIGVSHVKPIPIKIGSGLSTPIKRSSRHKFGHRQSSRFILENIFPVTSV